ncbi:hypothetical protein F5Y19DRAFT_478863 [Xylariaceae sp. FL1651]|nr:hypothetical protein F5Y19DRAFT_478863 [Xylariaceae sp. FL1651]
MVSAIEKLSHFELEQEAFRLQQVSASETYSFDSHGEFQKISPGSYWHLSQLVDLLYASCDQFPFAQSSKQIELLEYCNLQPNNLINQYCGEHCPFAAQRSGLTHLFRTFPKSHLALADYFTGCLARLLAKTITDRTLRSKILKLLAIQGTMMKKHIKRHSGLAVNIKNKDGIGEDEQELAFSTGVASHQSAPAWPITTSSKLQAMNEPKEGDIDVTIHQLFAMEKIIKVALTALSLHIHRDSLSKGFHYKVESTEKGFTAMSNQWQSLPASTPELVGIGRAALQLTQLNINSLPHPEPGNMSTDSPFTAVLQLSGTDRNDTEVSIQKIDDFVTTLWPMALCSSTIASEINDLLSKYPMAAVARPRLRQRPFQLTVTIHSSVNFSRQNRLYWEAREAGVAELFPAIQDMMESPGNISGNKRPTCTLAHLATTNDVWWSQLLQNRILIRAFIVAFVLFMLKITFRSHSWLGRQSMMITAGFSLFGWSLLADLIWRTNLAALTKRTLLKEENPASTEDSNDILELNDTLETPGERSSEHWQLHRDPEYQNQPSLQQSQEYTNSCLRNLLCNDAESILKDGYENRAVRIIERSGESDSTGTGDDDNDTGSHSSFDSSLRPVFIAQKHSIVERVMTEFHALLDSDHFARSHAGSNSSSGNKTSSSQDLSFASLSRGNSELDRRRKLSLSKPPGGLSDSEDDDDRDRKKIRVLHASGQAIRKRLACPYFRRNPTKYANSSCTGPGWNSIHRVKEHIYRRHRLPIQCACCGSTFEADSALNSHYRQPERCQTQSFEAPEGFNNDQERLLRKRTRQPIAEDEKWRVLYRILFPSDDEFAIPTPYYDNSQNSTWESQRDFEFEQYERYLRFELPRLVRSQVEEAVLGEMGPLESQLMTHLPEIIRDCQEKLFHSYRRLQESPQLIRVASNPRSLTAPISSMRTITETQPSDDLAPFFVPPRVASSQDATGCIPPALPSGLETNQLYADSGYITNMIDSGCLSRNFQSSPTFEAGQDDGQLSETAQMEVHDLSMCEWDGFDLDYLFGSQ